MAKTVNIPNHVEEITAVWLTKALQANGVVAALTAETAVATLTQTRIGTDESFTGGSLIRCEITYTSPHTDTPCSLIAKLSPTDPEFRMLFRETNRREVGFYTEFAAQNNLPVPHCYYGDFDDETGASILLLQDLGHYRMVAFADGCQPQEVQNAVRALATIHAQFWNDPRLQTASGIDILAEFPFVELWSQYPQAVAELLPDVTIPSHFFALGDTIAANISSLLNYLMETAPITCIHRDCHVDNILFSINEGDEPAIVLDWQGVGKGRGVYDIAYFLISSVPIEQRRQTEQTLLHEYHAQLKQAGVQDYGFEQCWFDYQLAVVSKLYVTLISTVLLDNSTPFKRAWRKTDLERLLAFCEDYAVEELLASL